MAEDTNRGAQYLKRELAEADARFFARLGFSSEIVEESRYCWRLILSRPGEQLASPPSPEPAPPMPVPVRVENRLRARRTA
jgi:hypothetical protein